MDKGNKTMQQHRTVQWLLILFIITTALFLYQVAAGVVAKSLTLLADSGHAAADVVGYAMNYGVERYKMRVMQGGDPASTALVAKVDTWGGGASVLVLIAATCFAILEALGRLNGEEGPEDFAAMGLTLLLFSIISTAANVATLILYRIWHPPSQEDSGEALEEGTVLEQGGTRSLLMPLEDATPLASLPDMPPAAALSAGNPVVTAPLTPTPIQRSATPTPMQRRRLNLMAGFAAGRCAGGCGDADCDAGVAPSPTPAPGGTPMGSTPSTQAASTPLGSAASGGGGGGSVASSWSTTLHMLVHPGCTGHHGGGAGGSRSVQAATEVPPSPVPFDSPDGSTTNTQASPLRSGSNARGAWSTTLHRLVHPGCTGHHESTSSSGASYQAVEEVNLNLSTAMLHLVADVLRGISILVAAVVMQSGVAARQLGKVDAVCALLVAGLVLLGAASMVSKFWASANCGACCMRREQVARRLSASSVATEDGEDEDGSEVQPAVELRPPRRENWLVVQGRESLLL